MSRFPDAVDPSRVGEYSARSFAGGGYVWDEVLEYRVWCHPKDGTSDFYYAYATYAEARDSFERHSGSAELADVEEPLALVLQREYIDESEPGKYVHVKRERITEWPVSFLTRPRRTEHTIPDFLAPDAPANRLDILRGLAPPRR